MTGEETGLTRSTTTNSDGIYTFAELPVGSYRVDASAPGFKGTSRTKVVLVVD